MQVCGQELEAQDVVPVTTAKVMVANYPVILHDFGYILETADFRERYRNAACAKCVAADALCLDAIDRWLLDQTAYVSVEQANQTNVNAPIEHGPPVARGYRPPRYGRAMVFPLDGDAKQFGQAALFDVKGCGVGPGVTPSHDTHSDGLEYLGVALGDFFFAWLIDDIFARTVPGFHTVPVYAVIDLGFDATGGWLGTAPAGLHVRRAHWREHAGLMPPMSGSDEELVGLQMELLMRSHGLSTANAGTAYRVAQTEDGEELYGPGGLMVETTDKHREKAAMVKDIARGTRIDLINIQLANEFSWNPKLGQIVDFGQVGGRAKFVAPITSRAKDGIFEIGHILQRGDPGYIQPDPDIAVDPDLCNRTSVNAFGFYMAAAFRHGRHDRKTSEGLMRQAFHRARRRR